MLARRLGVRFLSVSTDYSHVKTVGIIGAGVAGLQMARACGKYGFQCKVFDKAPDVGGLWRENYLGFGIQVPKPLFEFPEYPASYGDFAGGEEVQKYILDYTKKFNLLPSIQLNTTVEQLETRTDGQRGWNFTVTQNGKTTKEAFDYAVICTGMYSTTPFMPTLEGREDFKGIVLHSSEYRSPDQAKGKRVVVIGSGKSAMDVVCHAADLGAASSTLLFRHAHWGTPRNIAGLIPFKYVFLSRFGQGLVSWYKGAWPTAGAAVKAAHAALALPMRPVFAIVEALFAFQLGHKGDLRPAADVVKDFYGYAQVLDSGFKNRVRAGKVRAVKGQLARLEAGGIRLAAAAAGGGPGALVECDVVICATGFGKSYHFLPQATVAALGPEPDGLYLYRHCLPARVPDLAFVGSEVATISNIATHGIQAEWLAGVLGGRVKLPGPDAMQAEIDQTKAWKRSWMAETACRANLVLLHQIHFHDRLLKDMGVPHRRKGLNVFAEIFAPYQPRDYASLFTAPPPPPAAAR